MPASADKSTLERARRPLAAAAAVAALAAGIGGYAASDPAEGAGTENVVFILTDDQAFHEMSALPTVRSRIGGEGATFKRAYAPYPLCCPARVTTLTGQYMHNHLVRGNGGEFGGYANFTDQEADALPVHLQDDGYYTVQVGKYLNGYANDVPFVPPVPPGWDEWYGKVSQSNLYYDYALVEDPDGSGGVPGQYESYGSAPEDYQTDVLRDKAVNFIQGITGAQTPFALNFWVNAPHAPFTPAPRHFYDLGGTALPKLPGFNEEKINDKPAWLRAQAKKLGSGMRRKIAGERRRRLEMLMSVDEAVDAILDALEAEGILDDTYVIFTSDNGLFRGEHRIVGGKYLAYEPSSHVPLMIRGPGISAGVTSNELVSLADITQTILQISRGAPDPSLDGRSLLPFAQDPSRTTTRPILLEADTGPGRGSTPTEPQEASAASSLGLAGAAGVSNLDQEPGVPASVRTSAAHGNNAPAYRGLRTSRYSYVIYSNGQGELYDLKLDPGQLTNVIRNRRYRKVRRWLFGKLQRYVACDGAQCRLQAGPNPKPKKKLKKKRVKKQRRR
jgi:arylsulfatase A-like enzyme